MLTGQMYFNNTTKTIAYWLLGLWGLYIFMKRGLIGLLLSGAIALIAAAFVPNIEIVAGIVVIGGYILLLLFGRMRLWEPFMDTPKEITERIEKISNAPGITIEGPQGSSAKRAVRQEMGYAPNQGVTGVYDSYIEGFEDVSGGSAGTNQGAANISQPAIAQALSQLSPEFKNQIVQTVQSIASGSGAQQGGQTNTSATAEPSGQGQVSPFRSDPSGLFKLGEIPTESRDGPVIDAGATFMKAIQALDPSQIKSMSDDTAKMVDAQKNLIGLLNTMKPILQDGQKLMSTFTSVLGQTGGVAGAALGAQ